jgi:hypothetical protein
MQAPGAGFYTVTVTGVVDGMLPPEARGPSDDCVFICRLLELGSTLLQLPECWVECSPPKPGDLLMTVYLYAGSWSWVLHCYSDRSGGWDAPSQAGRPSDDYVLICRLLEQGSTLLQ